MVNLDESLRLMTMHVNVGCCPLLYIKEDGLQQTEIQREILLMCKVEGM